MEGKESGRGRARNLKTAAQCMPRFMNSTNRRNLTQSPMSLLERLREVVFRLIMLTAISKGDRRQHERPQDQHHHARPVHHPDSYQSQAVEDCIEFLKQSAASSEEDGAKMFDASEEMVGVSLTSALPVM